MSESSRKPQLPPHLLEFARRMRREPTDAETKIWNLVRDRRLAGFKFRRQFEVGQYILDFYCHEAKLAIELDGGQHAEGDASLRDDQRTAELAKVGIGVVRFWDNDVLKHTDAVAERIYEELITRCPAREG